MLPSGRLRQMFLIFFSMAFLVNISATSNDKSVFFLFVFFSLIDVAEIKVLLLLSSIICADILRDDLNTVNLNLSEFTCLSFLLILWDPVSWTAKLRPPFHQFYTSISLNNPKFPLKFAHFFSFSISFLKIGGLNNNCRSLSKVQ